MSVKEQVRKLWKQCFGDSDEFIDLYFRERYSDKINSYIEKDGKIVSALQRIPYSMTCFGEEIPMSYISGACTDISYRNKGLMSNLLTLAHRSMYEEGKWISSLIPAEEWLVDYYARFGYVLSFQQHIKLLTGMSNSVNNFSFPLHISRIDLCKTLSPDIYSYFCKQLRVLPFCVQHTENDFQTILSDWQLGGGELWAVYHESHIVGLAFCLFCEGSLLVRECLVADNEVRERLLGFLATHYAVDGMKIISSSAGNLRVYGMARVIHVEQMLRLYARHSSASFYLEIEGDRDIPENNGFYVVENGICRRGFIEGKDYRKETIAGLSRLLFEGHFPYMNLMLD